MHEVVVRLGATRLGDERGAPQGEQLARVCLAEPDRVSRAP
ncbi:hypothetical protein HNR02_002588 [Amycolatopsis endophytica]|uniref:Uncharacterized protein n=1 Tax=Amycolatopsis endophytica TaxID=860233 RepID=A0A853B364_9PSEU|nr:hypothetical protein [Amycolatopsis endophytica]NYI89265.1 hypothetical protein [Amycolatopsis endophytica]